MLELDELPTGSLEIQKGTALIIALMLSVAPRLTRQEVKDILAQTAVKIGRGYKKSDGHSPKFGFGRVDAAAAVAAALALSRNVETASKTRI